MDALITLGILIGCTAPELVKEIDLRIGWAKRKRNEKYYRKEKAAVDAATDSKELDKLTCRYYTLFFEKNQAG